MIELAAQQRVGADEFRAGSGRFGFAAALAAQRGVRQTGMGWMRRFGIAVIHLLSLPTAVLLAVAIIIPMARGPAIDIHVGDTYFIVLHFHTTILLACLLLLATIVSFRYGRWNWGLKAAWGLLALHVVSAFLLPPPPDLQPGAPDAAILVQQSQFLDWFFVVSALTALIATLLGLLISVVRTLRLEHEVMPA